MYVSHFNFFDVHILLVYKGVRVYIWQEGKFSSCGLLLELISELRKGSIGDNWVRGGLDWIFTGIGLGARHCIVKTTKSKIEMLATIIHVLIVRFMYFLYPAYGNNKLLIVAYRYNITIILYSLWIKKSPKIRVTCQPNYCMPFCRRWPCWPTFRYFKVL